MRGGARRSTAMSRMYPTAPRRPPATAPPLVNDVALFRSELDAAQSAALRRDVAPAGLLAKRSTVSAICEDSNSQFSNGQARRGTRR